MLEMFGLRENVSVEQILPAQPRSSREERPNRQPCQDAAKNLPVEPLPKFGGGSVGSPEVPPTARTIMVEHVPS